jgi:DNA-binding protein HU-beta
MFARRFHQVTSYWEVTHVNKGELIEALAEATDMTRAEAGRALEAVIETISGELVRGGQVALVGFGTFGTSKRNARTGKNPRTGESIKIPARTVPKFTPGKGLKDAVAGGKKGGGKSSAKGGAKAPAKGGAKGGGKGGAKKR